MFTDLTLGTLSHLREDSAYLSSVLIGFLPHEQIMRNRLTMFTDITEDTKSHYEDTDHRNYSCRLQLAEHYRADYQVPLQDSSQTLQ